jgi:hypothetical protein
VTGAAGVGRGECVLSLRWEAKVTLVSHHEVGVLTPIRNVSQQTGSRGERLSEATRLRLGCH